MQISDHPILEKPSEDNITIYLEGEPLKGRKGQTIAAVLMGNNIKMFGVSRKLRQARGFFCGNGRCCSCFMTVNGFEHVLTCMRLAEDGMEIKINNEDPNVRGEQDEY